MEATATEPVNANGAVCEFDSVDNSALQVVISLSAAVPDGPVARLSASFPPASWAPPARNTRWGSGFDPPWRGGGGSPLSRAPTAAKLLVSARLASCR